MSPGAVRSDTEWLRGAPIDTPRQGWRQSQNPDLDVAFANVAPPAGTTRPVQRVTGGLRLGLFVQAELRP